MKYDMKNINHTLRVLQYLYGSVDLGGAETIVVNMQKEVKSYDCRFDYIVFEDRKFYFTDIIIENGGTIIPVLTPNRLPLPMKVMVRWHKLYKILKSGKYDCFHCNCDTAYRFVELAIAKMAGVPVRIVHSHNSSIDDFTFKWKLKKLSHYICRKFLPLFATSLFACSKSAADWMYGKNYKKKPIYIIANGIDTESFAFKKEIRVRTRKLLNADDNDILICNVGRFSEVKNQSLLLKILKIAIEKKGQQVKLLLLGDGKLKEKLKNEAIQLEIDKNVIFTGNVSNVNEHLMASDIYIMPSLYEGLPVSGIEAQCTGLHLLVSESVSKELNLSHNVSFISLEHKPQDWWSEADKLLNSKIDREISYKVLEDAGYSIKKTAKFVYEVYSEVIQ